MNRKLLLPLSIVLILAVVVFIYFALTQRSDFYGTLSIPCSDTAELSYSGSVNLLVRVKNKCGDSMRVETKTRRGDWTPLSTVQRRTLGPMTEVVNFDTNTVALVGLNRGDRIRFICFNGEFDSCKVDVKNIANERDFVPSSAGIIPCGNRVGTKVYNFSSSSSMAVRINWSSVCGTGGIFRPSKPRVFVKDNNQQNTTSEVPASEIILNNSNGGSARLNDYAFGGSPRGGRELVIECPGNSDTCIYSISVKGR